MAEKGFCSFSHEEPSSSPRASYRAMTDRRTRPPNKQSSSSTMTTLTSADSFGTLEGPLARSLEHALVADEDDDDTETTSLINHHHQQPQPLSRQNIEPPPVIRQVPLNDDKEIPVKATNYQTFPHHQASSSHPPEQIYYAEYFPHQPRISSSSQEPSSTTTTSHHHHPPRRPDPYWWTWWSSMMEFCHSTSYHMASTVIFWRKRGGRWVVGPPMGPTPPPLPDHHQHNFWWKALAGLTLCIVLGLGQWGQQQRRKNKAYILTEPEWTWDHNMYNPRQQPSPVAVNENTNSSSDNDPSAYSNQAPSATFPFSPPSSSSSSSSNFPSDLPATVERYWLLTQEVGAAPALQQMADISSRPNRAYARQWGRDYVRYSNGSSPTSKSCFDKVLVMNAILDRQQQQQQQQQHHGADFWLSGAASMSRFVMYDIMALFPPDAIMTDLDFDLLDLLPADKLVALAGWEPGGPPSQESRTGIVLFNLKHVLSSILAKRWLHTIQTYDITCGAGNDMRILVQLIESVLLEQQELLLDEQDQDNTESTVPRAIQPVNVSSVIVSLEETIDGFVLKDGKHVIKGIPPAVPSSRDAMLMSKSSEYHAMLQATADAVCYRYYPKCEVL